MFAENALYVNTNHTHISIRFSWQLGTTRKSQEVAIQLSPPKYLVRTRSPWKENFDPVFQSQIVTQVFGNSTNYFSKYLLGGYYSEQDSSHLGCNSEEKNNTKTSVLMKLTLQLREVSM